MARLGGALWGYEDTYNEARTELFLDMHISLMLVSYVNIMYWYVAMALSGSNDMTLFEIPSGMPS